MNINAINSPGHQRPPAPVPPSNQPDPIPEESDGNDEPAAIGQDQTTDSTADDNDDSDGDKAQGVLRNLEAGHYRGVADVRLRINFFEELSARAAQTAGAVAGEQAGSFTNTISGQIDTLLNEFTVDEETQASIDELRSEYESAIGSTINEFADNYDGDALAQALQSSYDAFMEQLRVLLTPVEEPQEEGTEGIDPPDSGGADDTGVDDSGDVTDVPVDQGGATGDEVTDPDPPVVSDTIEADPFDALFTAFQDALSGLLAEINTATQLPDPSPPNGNGVAYDKFMEIYNELRGISNEVDQVS